MTFVTSEDMYESMEEETQANPTPWLHGRVGRAEVAQLFQSTGGSDGSFLIRESTRNAGEYVLSLLYRNEVEHYIISKVQGQFTIDDGPPFNTLKELVTWYSSNQDRLPTPLRVPISAGRNSQPSLEQRTSSMSLGGRAPAPAPAAAPAPAGGRGPAPALPGGGGGGSRKPAPALPVEEPVPSLPSRRAAPALPAEVQVQSGPSPYSMSDTFEGIVGITPADEPLPAPPPGARANPMPLPARGASAGRTFQNPQSIPAAAAAPLPSRGSNSSMGSTTSSGPREFTKHSKVKKWIDRQDQALAVDLQDREEESRNLPEGFSKDSMETAQRREENFRKAALAEEKLYITWMNNHLKKVGRSVSDIDESLQDGTVIIEVIKSVSGQNAPRYSKKAHVVQQQLDNWNVIVKWLGKLGVPVENTGDASDPRHNVGLNPLELHKLDRREILKLFSKIMQYESSLARR